MSDYAEERKLNLFYSKFFQAFEGFVARSACFSSISEGWWPGLCYRGSAETRCSLWRRAGQVLIQQSISNHKLFSSGLPSWHPWPTCPLFRCPNTSGWDSSVQRTLFQKSCLLSALSGKHQPGAQRAKVSSFSPPMKNLFQTLKALSQQQQQEPASCVVLGGLETPPSLLLLVWSCLDSQAWIWWLWVWISQTCSLFCGSADFHLVLLPHLTFLKLHWLKSLVFINKSLGLLPGPFWSNNDIKCPHVITRAFS